MPADGLTPYQLQELDNHLIYAGSGCDEDYYEDVYDEADECDHGYGFDENCPICDEEDSDDEL